ncbi:MAG: DnaA/Hda family protein [Pseudomonadota bacterium]
MAAQLPLDISLEPSFERDDLVEAPANQAAIAFVDAWPHWPSPIAMLIGPEGSGKSHLARVWVDRSGAKLLDTAALSPSDFAEAGHYLVEDLDRAAFNETNIFHLINAVRQSGCTLLVTSRKPANAFAIELPDLASRLRAASVATIQPPDDQLLESVLRKLISDRQMAVDDATVQYLVNRMERSLAAAGQVVAELDHIALVEKRPITRPLAGRVLDALYSAEEGG